MPTKRTATVEELKALAHPVRLRILRLCLEKSRTNQELADRLKIAPASVLRHVRLLTETRLLVAEEPRRGPRGVIERPYRATGLSWHLSFNAGEPELTHQAELAIVDAYRAELAERLESEPDAASYCSRTVLWMSDADHAEFRRRMYELMEEYVEPRGEATEPFSFLWAMHTQEP